MGRPKTFDRASALDKAVLLFWKRGFDGTSISDLTVEMGVSPPTLYAAFGSKHDLYRSVIERYYDFHGGRERSDAFDKASTAFEAIRGYLTSAANKLSDSSVPSGCMISTGNLFHGHETAAAAELTSRMRCSTADMFERRFARAKIDGELPGHVDAVALGAFYAAVAQGMAIQAIDGVPADIFGTVISLALNAWPGVRPTAVV